MNRLLLVLLAACGRADTPTNDRDYDGVVDADDPCPDDDDTLPGVDGTCPTGLAVQRLEGTLPHAVLQRDGDTCTARLAGALATPPSDAQAVLDVWADGVRVGSQTSAVDGDGFSLSAPLTAGLVAYELRLRLRVGDVESAVISVPDVACGDLVLINGQSNAAAVDLAGEGLATAWESPWIRSFGTTTLGCCAEHPTTPSNADVASDLTWRRADGLGLDPRGAVGVWGLRLAGEIVARQQVPVGVINGAFGGTTITWHQRDDAEPENLDTIYGRFLYRARAAGAADTAHVLVWYQGESDGGESRPGAVPSGWVAGFTALRDDWRADFPSLEQLYVVQVREGCSVDPTNDAVAEVAFFDADGNGLGGDALRMAPPTTWSRWATGPLAVPAGATSASLTLYTPGQPPDVWFDDVAFGPVDGASVVANGGFEDADPYPVAPWDTAGFVTWHAGGHASDHAVSSWGWELTSQQVPVEDGVHHALELWARADEVQPDIREVQRHLPATVPDVTLVSATALVGHDGCHYATAGYEQLALDLYRLLARDRYASGVVDDVQAPNAARAVRVAPDVIELEFEPFAGTLVLQEGFERSFVIAGARVESGEVVGQKVRLQLTEPTDAATLSYPGHPYDGGDVVTALGVGILAFVDLPIDEP